MKKIIATGKRMNGVETSTSRETAVYSSSVFSGRRMYFIDVRKASPDTNYLVISSSVVDKDGNRSRSNIMLFNNDFHRFVEELNKTAVYFKDPTEEVKE